jgi:mannose-6-phosphate isomerase
VTVSSPGGIPETDHRPWGSYTVLDDGVTHKVKRITVLPGKRLSYQRHARRSEHWFIVTGTARVTLDGAQVELTAGQSVDIPVGTDHRIQNATDTEVVLVEVQHGDYFGEDDIVRLEDDYGRVDP